MSLLNQDVHLLNPLIMTLFGEFWWAKIFWELLLPICSPDDWESVTFLNCVKNKKAHKNQFCELSSVLVCQPVIPLGFEPRTHTLKVYCSTSWATESSSRFTLLYFQIAIGMSYGIFFLVCFELPGWALNLKATLKAAWFCQIQGISRNWGRKGNTIWNICKGGF